jgi:hypothetical protein
MKEQKKLNQTEIMAEVERRVNQQIDPEATYTIPGQAIVQLYALIDEVPMKFARQLLPTLAMNITRITEGQEKGSQE